MGVNSGCDEFCIGVILGFYWGKKERIMEKNMETTILGYIEFMGPF